MSKYILSGWGWAMPQPTQGVIKYDDLTEDEFYEEIVGAISMIGNPILARILNIQYSPGHISLKPGDVAYVISVKGGKIPYGAKELPDNVSLKFTKTELVEAAI